MSDRRINSSVAGGRGFDSNQGERNVDATVGWGNEAFSPAPHSRSEDQQMHGRAHREYNSNCPEVDWSRDSIVRFERGVRHLTGATVIAIYDKHFNIWDLGLFS